MLEHTTKAAMLDNINPHGGIDFSDVAVAALRDKEQMRLGDAMDLCNRWMLDGIGFGGSFLEHTVA